METSSYFNAMAGDPGQVLAQAIGDGNTIIFTTSSRLQPAALHCAVEHPNAIIFSCTQISSHRYIRTYHYRLYEAKFVLGAIAGALAGSDKIGYLAYLSDTVEDKEMRMVHIRAHTRRDQRVRPGGTDGQPPGNGVSGVVRGGYPGPSDKAFDG